MSIEKALLKIAKQINSYDEASLMSLWERFAERVNRFDPTAEWEEAAMSLAIIQGMRMKNQLFNYNLAESRRRPSERGVDLAALTVPEPEEGEAGKSARETGKTDPLKKGSKSGAPEVGHKRGKLLELKPRKK
ncbi:MAG: hypothetical protein V3573_08070 [Desulfovibrionaceae bacterium]